jgi:hypothetical protein
LRVITAQTFKFTSAASGLPLFVADVIRKDVSANSMR